MIFILMYGVKVNNPDIDNKVYDSTLKIYYLYLRRKVRGIWGEDILIIKEVIR